MTKNSLRQDIASPVDAGWGNLVSEIKKFRGEGPVPDEILELARSVVLAQNLADDANKVVAEAKSALKLAMQECGLTRVDVQDTAVFKLTTKSVKRPNKKYFTKIFGEDKVKEIWENAPERTTTSMSMERVEPEEPDEPAE